MDNDFTTDDHSILDEIEYDDLPDPRCPRCGGELDMYHINEWGDVGCECPSCKAYWENGELKNDGSA